MSPIASVRPDKIIKLPFIPFSRGARQMLISLNLSTIRGQKLPITQCIDIAAKCGYGGIEPWPDDLEKHVQSGGTLSDVRKRLSDNGLKVTGAIHWSDWMVDDEAKRAKAIED